MPQGGLSIFGSGLKLQANSPGTADAGNANIAGKMIAQQFTTNPLGTGAGIAPEIFGHGITNGGGLSSVIFGNGLTTGTTGHHMVFGLGSASYAQSSLAMGEQVQCGFPGTLASNLVAVGFTVSVGTTNQTQAQVGYGANIQLNAGAQSVALGSNIQALSPNSSDGPMVALGSTIQCANNLSTQLALFGLGITIPVAAKDNVLIMGYWNGTGTSGTMPVPVSNSIRIGNAAQPTVFIGPYQFANGMAANQRNVADVNTAITAADSVVAMSSITAARAWTLPLANSVPAGWRVTVCDDSGSVTGVNSLTINRSGADTINGLTSAAMITAYAVREFKSDGVSKYTILNAH